MAGTAPSVELRAVAQAIADALPTTVEEVVLTGSVSRGVADDVSDIEMLIVTGGEFDLEDCFTVAAASGLTDLGTWVSRPCRRSGSRGTATACRSSSSGGRTRTLRRRFRPSSRAIS